MIIPDMPEQEYHAHPALSSSQARHILDSPARYKYELDHPTHTDAMDIGSAVHARVLGVGWGVQEIPFDSWRSKAAQDLKDEARDVGLIPMLSKDVAEVGRISDAVLAQAGGWFELAGEREASVFATIDGVDVRARFDVLSEPVDGARVAVDLKTTGGRSNRAGFTKSVATYGYDVQEAHYRDTLHAATGEDVGFVFVVVEKQAPYLVGVHDLSERWRLIGARKAARARELLTECLGSGEWPGYPTDVQTLEPPSWVVYESEANHVTSDASADW